MPEIRNALAGFPGLKGTWVWSWPLNEMDGSVLACQAHRVEATSILSDITHHEPKDQGLNSFFIDAKDNQSLLQPGSWRLSFLPHLGCLVVSVHSERWIAGLGPGGSQRDRDSSRDSLGRSLWREMAGEGTSD